MEARSGGDLRDPAVLATYRYAPADHLDGLLRRVADRHAGTRWELRSPLLSLVADPTDDTVLVSGSDTRLHSCCAGPAGASWEVHTHRRAPDVAHLHRVSLEELRWNLAVWCSRGRLPETVDPFSPVAVSGPGPTSPAACSPRRPCRSSPCWPSASTARSTWPDLLGPPPHPRVRGAGRPRCLGLLEQRPERGRRPRRRRRPPRRRRARRAAPPARKAAGWHERRPLQGAVHRARGRRQDHGHPDHQRQPADDDRRRRHRRDPRPQALHHRGHGLRRDPPGPHEVVHLYGTPGQDRFDFMWEILQEAPWGC